MHRREHIDAAGGEDARHLGDDASGVRDEDKRMLVKDDVELAVAERTQVTHVRPQIGELGTSAARETADRRELRAADVHERGRRAELGEEDRVPTAAAGKGKHALSLEIDPVKRAVCYPIEEAPFSRSAPRRGALRPGVGNARLREALPHPLVVRAYFVDRDSFGHAEIVAA